MAARCTEALREVWHEPEHPTKKTELRLRFGMLITLCLGLFGSYYAYDIPAATESQMASYFGESNSTDPDATSNTFNYDFNLLYSVYSWPNVILPFFGGYISDLLGVRLMGVVFVALITLGQFITAIGISTTNESVAWGIMWTGRTVFGFGGESLSVVQSAFVAAYFQGKELAFALGVNLALARIGSVINDVASAAIGNQYSVPIAYWVGLIVCGISLIGMVVAYYMDVNAENRLRKNQGLPPLANQGLFYQLFCRCCQRRRQQQYQQAATEDGDGAIAPAEQPAAPTEEIHITAVFKFPPIFWVLTLSCVTVYIDVLTFNNNCASFVAQKYLASKPLWQIPDKDKDSMYLQANSVMLITYLVAGLLTPFFGAAIDRLGYRAILNVVAAVLITCVHAILAFTDVYPTGPLVMLGICYSIYASALWPSIALVIEPKYQATAYGVVTAVQNLGMAVSPLIVAKFMPSSNCATKEECVKGWNNTEIFFVCMGIAGTVSGILLNIIDYSNKYHILNMSDKAVQALKAADARKEAESGQRVADGAIHTPLLE